MVTEGVDKGTEMTEKVNAGIKFAFGQGSGTTKFVTRVCPFAPRQSFAL